MTPTEKLILECLRYLLGNRDFEGSLDGSKLMIKIDEALSSKLGEMDYGEDVTNPEGSPSSESKSRGKE